MNKKINTALNPGMGERIKKIRKPLKQNNFSNLIGVSQGNISKIEKGMVPEPNILLRISKYGKTTIEYLLTGEEPGFQKIIGFNEKYLPKGISLINKVKGPGSAGQGVMVDDHVDIQLAFRDEWLGKYGGPENLFAIVIEGDSMEPTLFNNDIVVVNRNEQQVHPGGGIYSLVWQDKRMIKRLQINPNTKTLTIKSDNSNYDDLTSPLDDLKIEGKLIWYGREMK